MREEVGGWKPSISLEREEAKSGQWVESSEAAGASDQFLREKLDTGVGGNR